MNLKKNIREVFPKRKGLELLKKRLRLPDKGEKKIRKSMISKWKRIEYLTRR